MKRFGFWSRTIPKQKRNKKLADGINVVIQSTNGSEGDEFLMTGSAQLDRENQMVHGLCERRRETAILRLKVVNPNRLAVVVSRKRTEPCRNSQSACHSEIMRKHLKPTISWNSETTTRSKDPPSYIIHIRTYVHTPWINLGNSYEKGDMFSCGNHSGISLIGTATKLVASTVLH